MKALFFRINNFYLFLFFFTLNLPFTIQSFISYKMEVPINGEELELLSINNMGDLCNPWIPSLFSPIILIRPEIYVGEGWKEYLLVDIPSVSHYNADIMIYSYDTIKIFNRYNVLLGQIRFYSIQNYCLFGLLNKKASFYKLQENQILLNQLKAIQPNIKKIFSFDKWEINKNVINSYFYFGDSHENFNSNKKNGIIGSCENNQNNTFWGCAFDRISFNNSIIDLTTENNTLYTIYFSSEKHNIIFPKSFENKFNNLTNNQCHYNDSYYSSNTNLFCEKFFNKNGYDLITLISDIMNITL